MSKEDKLIEVLNNMIKLVEPIYYKDFNKKIKAINNEDLIKYEEKESVVGVTNINNNDYAISTLSIIATITDILIDKRLAFNVEDTGVISGVKFYEPLV